MPEHFDAALSYRTVAAMSNIVIARSRHKVIPVDVSTDPARTDPSTYGRTHQECRGRRSVVINCNAGRRLQDSRRKR
jgi:hypothetical protein